MIRSRCRSQRDSGPDGLEDQSRRCSRPSPARMRSGRLRGAARVLLKQRATKGFAPEDLPHEIRSILTLSPATREGCSWLTPVLIERSEWPGQLRNAAGGEE